MGKYFENSTTYSTTIGYYVVNFIYETMTINEDNNSYGRLFKPGELQFKTAYLRSMQANTD